MFGLRLSGVQHRGGGVTHTTPCRENPQKMVIGAGSSVRGKIFPGLTFLSQCKSVNSLFVVSLGLALL